MVSLRYTPSAVFNVADELHAFRVELLQVCPRFSRRNVPRALQLGQQRKRLAHAQRIVHVAGCRLNRLGSDNGTNHRVRQRRDLRNPFELGSRMRRGGLNTRVPLQCLLNVCGQRDASNDGPARRTGHSRTRSG